MTLLVDTILHNRTIGNPLNPAQGRVDWPDYDVIFRDLSRAQKFVIERSVSVAADSVSVEEWQRIKTHCIPPYRLCWFETLASDRPGFVNGRPVAPDELPPYRIGALCRSLTKDSIAPYCMSLFWVDRTKDWFTPAMSVIWDPLDTLNKPQSRLAQEIGAIAIHSPYWEKTTEKVGKHVLENMLNQASENDWSGEGLYWTSILGLLAAKNAVETVPVSQERLNAIRAKRRKPPLSDHHVCRIVINRKHGGIKPGVSLDSVRAHFVRGHFKIRKTGIYWWSPHVRGDLGKGFASKSYSVSL